ncbi:MAG: hypothetical protein V4584_18780 [Verrucomicrobiota bacterium]
MKVSHLIPPVAALALVGAWNSFQLRSISALEKDGTILRGKISTAVASGNLPGDSPGRSKPTSSAPKSANTSTDWKELSARLIEAETSGEKSQLLAMIDFKKRLSEMTKEEMIAALDEIDGLDLTDDQRRMLEEAIIDPLIKADPEYALNRFADQIEADSNGIGWQLSTALCDWAKKDLAGATAWFDRQIAEGNFESKTLDGKSDMRVKFESALLETLLSTDLDAARSRLAAIPEEQRREVLEQLPFPDLGAPDQKAYADLVRDLVPSDERAGSFANIATQLIENGGSYDKVTAFLDSVQATPAERIASAIQTANSQLSSIALEGNVTRADVDRLREWLTRQAPGQMDSITGKAIAEAAQDDGKFQFSEASQLALQYQKSSGNDDVLVSFLESYSARSNIEEAIHLADMISDPKRREAILKHLK